MKGKEREEEGKAKRKGKERKGRKVVPLARQLSGGARHDPRYAALKLAGRTAGLESCRTTPSRLATWHVVGTSSLLGH